MIDHQPYDYDCTVLHDAQGSLTPASWILVLPWRDHDSTENHDAGGSESNFREKFAPAVADPAIMTGLVI